MKQRIQKMLDWFYWLRKWTVTAITYISVRFFGSESSWDELWNEKFNTFKHTNRDLSRAEDVSLILAEVKEGVKNSESRLAAITDKCKTLLTLSSLLLTFVALVFTKTSFDSIWMRIILLVSALAFFNAVILLLVILGVRTAMTTVIEQKEVDLPSRDFAKALINFLLQCQADLDNRTDYLVEVYKVARCFVLFAFTGLSLLLSLNLFFISPQDTAKVVASELRADTNFLQSVRGEKGDRGPKGDPGPRGVPGPKGDRGENGETNRNVNHK